MSEVEEIYSDTEVASRSYLTEKADTATSQITRSTTPILALDIPEPPLGKAPSPSNPSLIPFKLPKGQKNQIPNWKKSPNQLTKPRQSNIIE